MRRDGFWNRTGGIMALGVLVHGVVMDLNNPEQVKDHPSDYGVTYMVRGLNDSTATVISLTPVIFDTDL